MRYGRLSRVEMVHYDLFHLPFELEQLLEEMERVQDVRVFSDNGEEASRLSLVEVRVEVEV